MPILTNSLLLIFGLVILIFSSDLLIQCSVKLSLSFKLTPLFIGLVLVAFGTSAPEAGVSIVAAASNQSGVALGNIIGSNICNIGLILGLCAVIFPLSVDKGLLKREMPLMLLATGLLYVLSRDLLISRLDALIFIAVFIAFLYISFKGAKTSFDPKETEQFTFYRIIKNTSSRFKLFSLVSLSLLGLLLGAKFMVDGGVSLARIFGISPWIIGVTIFAVGTSLPELVASLGAAFKKVHGISIGNIVGSNIFNILFVLGIAALIRPISVESSVVGFELPVLLLFSFGLFVIMRTGHKISRWEGLTLLLGYLGFIVLLLKP